MTPCPQYDHQSDFCVYDDVSTVWKFHWFILAGFLQPPAWIPANFYRRDNRSSGLLQFYRSTHHSATLPLRACVRYWPYHGVGTCASVLTSRPPRRFIDSDSNSSFFPRKMLSCRFEIFLFLSISALHGMILLCR